MKVRVAVISDLHVGPGARAKDLYVSSASNSKEPVLDEDFLRRFKELSTQIGATSANGQGIDLLCVTGDITDGAEPEEFRKASLAVERIAADLGVSSDQVFFVPGNHDLNWKLAGSSPDPYYQLQRYGPASIGDLVFAKRNGELAQGNLFQAPYCGIWKTSNAVVAAFNSAEHDGPSPPQGQHFGLVSQEALESINAYFSTRAPSNQEIRICLIHHHPKAYTNPRPAEADFSALVNAEKLLTALGEHRFDLLIHGHKHFPRVWTNAGGNTHPVVVLGSGSFSARLKSELMGTTANHFHIVELERNLAPGASPLAPAQGVVKSWMYSLTDGWIEAHVKTGIRHNFPFGSHVTYDNLLAVLSAQVASSLQTENFVEVSDLIRRDTVIGFADPVQLHRALSEVCRVQQLRFKGDKDTSPNHWALLKGG